MRCHLPPNANSAEESTWATSSPSTSSRASGTPATSPSTSTSRTGSTRPSRSSAGDENAFWFLDFHWSRGLTPLAATLWSADGYCWGTQGASEKLPLPPGRGITCRFAGTHLYGSPIPEADPREIGARANRLGTNLPHFLQNYRAIWEAGRDELEATWDYFQGVDFASVPTADLGGLIQQGRRYHKRAMEIHFDVMYPMLVNFLGFYGACAELGIDTNLVGKFLQGEDTKIMELDRELYGLAVKARNAGLAQVFADNEPGDLRAALSAHGGSASQWLTDFDDFLAVYGHRTEATCDVGLPSWIEDDSNAFGNIKTFLLKEDRPRLRRRRAQRASRSATRPSRWPAPASPRRSRPCSTAAWPPNQAANFPWWQDDHNFYIDLQGHAADAAGLPGARAARSDADHKDDMLYLFWPEMLDVAAGKPYAGELQEPGATAQAVLRPLAQPAQRDCPRCWAPSRSRSNDPILIEIFGHEHRSCAR